jgi:Ca-activated chloride channel family protein
MSELAAFHFLRPDLLYWLVPSALYALYLWLRGAARSPWSGAVSPQLLPHLLGRAGARRWVRPETLLLVTAALAALAAAGPSFAARSDASDPKDSRLIVVFELSRSMSRRDVSPSRVERARLALLDLLRQRPESPTALVVVAGSAHVLMPFTDDAAALAPSVQALSPELMPFDGQAFEQAARRVEQLARGQEPPPAVLVVSDGMPPAGVAAFTRLRREQGLGLVTLSIGRDDASLARLASRSGGAHIALSFGARDTARVLSAIAQTRAARLAPGDAHFWRDDGPWLALPLAAAIALWFRRGWVLPRLALAALALPIGACSPGVEGIWLTPDQQGRLRFERGDYLGAAARFEDPLWKGLSFYAAEQWDTAVQSFVSVEGPVGLFCLGNAYAQGGKLQSALETYERGLRIAPTDRKLRKNRDKLRELLRSLQEDTDLESAKSEERDHGDRAAALDRSQLAKALSDQPPPSAVAQAAAQDPIEERAWLSRLSTDPSEFLQRKLALQAARGDAR